MVNTLRGVDRSRVSFIVPKIETLFDIKEQINVYELYKYHKYNLLLGSVSEVGTKWGLFFVGGRGVMVLG